MSKYKEWKVGQYLRELSIITIGIAITFGGNELVSSINAKKALKEELKAVEAELIENKAYIEDILSYYDDVYVYRDLIARKYNGEEVNADSIKTYSFTFNQILNFNYKKDAFEMMKYSGRLTDIKDKSLILNIMECYRLMEQAKETHDMYMSWKAELLNSAFEVDDKARDIISDPKLVKVRTFILGTNGMEDPFKESKEQIEKVMSLNFTHL